MRILIVDDEALALERLRTLCAEIEDVEVVGEALNGDAALLEISRLLPDLVILDVQMPGRNGLRTAAAMETEQRPEIVFVTAHEHYAPDAFEVDAADYLLKPVRFDRLRQAVTRARRRRVMRVQAERVDMLARELEAMKAAGRSDADTGFWIPERNGQRRVPLDAIDWIEAARDYVLLHTDARSYMLRTTMGALEAKLADSPLLRVHRSAFVRLDRVTEIRRGPRSIMLVLGDGAQVQVGPSYVDTIQDALGLG